MKFLIVEDDAEMAESIGADLKARGHEAVIAWNGREGFGLATAALPGSGLGLSLVAAIAELHGLDCSASDNHPGLRVTLATSPKDEG